MRILTWCALSSLIAALPLSIDIRPAAAQGTPPTAVTSPTGAEPATSAPAKGPSFASGGLKATVVTVAPAANSATLSLVLENTGKDDLLVAIIGQANGVNNGFTLASTNISGVAYCNPGGNLDRAAKIKMCLTGADPQLPIQEFTLLEHGNAISFTITLGGDEAYSKVDKALPLAFAMTVATLRDSQLSDTPSSDALQPPHGAKDVATLPRGLRFVSLGIPAVPLSE